MKASISGITNFNGGDGQLTNLALLDTYLIVRVPRSNLDATAREKPRSVLVLLLGKLGILPHPLDSPLRATSWAYLNVDMGEIRKITY